MRIKETVINKIKDNVPVRLKLGLALGCSEQWIIKQIDRNKDNGILTKEAAVRVIEEETGLDRSKILESVKLQRA